MAKIDLLPQVLDLALYAGDGANFRLTVTNKLNEPVPLIGEIEAEIRVKRFDPDPPSAYFAVDLSGSNEGIVLLSLTGAQTQALIVEGKRFSGVWDVQWTPTGLQPRTLCQGKVECYNDVSR